MTLTVLVGGARAGKSRLAQQMLGIHPAVVFVATAEPRDEEMRQRIERHRANRPSSWRTIEEPNEIERTMLDLVDTDAVLVDCLTLWVANLLEAGLAGDEIVERANRLAELAASREGATVVVTNEVGSGIVPFDPDTRTYRDVLGSVNAAVSARASCVFLVVAGRLMALETFEQAVAREPSP